MAGIRMFEEQLRMLAPHTFNALQRLVPAMADAAKSEGKRTFLGRDRGQIAYSKFLTELKATVQSMVLDGVVKESTSSIDVIAALGDKLRIFSMAFPNWQDAYGYANSLFADRVHEATALVERIRSMP